MKCKSCNYENQKGSQYCENCGINLGEIAANNKSKRSYIIGVIICVFGIIGLLNYKEPRDVLFGVFFIVFGFSLMPYIYTKINNNQVKRLRIIVPIVVFITFAIIMQIYEPFNNENAPSSNTNEEQNTLKDGSFNNNNQEEQNISSSNNLQDTTKHEQITTDKPKQNYDIEDSLTNIAYTYYQNEARGNSKYFKKRVKVTATITDISIDKSIFFNTGVTIHLKEEGAKYRLMCNNEDGISGITEYNRNEQITVIGTMNTMAGSSLLMNKCEIVN